MSTTTKPIWEDPFAIFLACATAAAASAMLLIQYVTIPYVMAPAAELWMSYVLPPFEAHVTSYEVLIETIRAGPSVAGFLAFFAALNAALLLTFVPLTITVGVPLAVSYVVWMRLVYGRILDGDSQ